MQKTLLGGIGVATTAVEYGSVHLNMVLLLAQSHTCCNPDVVEGKEDDPDDPRLPLVD
jgi:hypothetical protein